MVSFGRLAVQAKRLIDQRGGMDSVKQDLGELRNIAKGPGTPQDKVKQAGEALRDPGARAGAVAGEPQPATASPAVEHPAGGPAGGPAVEHPADDTAEGTPGPA